MLAVSVRRAVRTITAPARREPPVTDPQLRCLLCDLILVDEGSSQPSEACRQCGRRVLAGQTTDPTAPVLEPLHKPAPADLDLLPETAVTSPPTIRAEPPVPPPLAAPTVLEDDIPTATVVRKPSSADVPTIPPARRTTTDPNSVPYTARRVPEAKPAPRFPEPPANRPSQPPPAPPRPGGKAIPPFPARTTLPDPARTSSAPPRPQLFRALGVLGCMTLLAALALVVIVFAVVAGLRAGLKKSAVEPPAIVRPV